MASDTIPAEHASLASVPPAPVAPTELSQPVYSVSNANQERGNYGIIEKGVRTADASHTEALKSAEKTKPSVSPSSDPIPAHAAATTELQAPVEAQNQEEEPVPKLDHDPQPGEKRDIDSTVNAEAATAPSKASVAASAPTPAIKGRTEVLPDQADEPEPKKQRIEQGRGLTENANGSVSTTANGEPRKPGRPKKEKAKDAMKKLVPTDGIGSRTRSRTKRT